MNRPDESVRGHHAAIRTRRFAALTSQSERNMLLGIVLSVTAVSAAMSYFLTHLFGIDVISSLLNTPKDCWQDWGLNIGQHCFSDYATTADAGVQANPWTFEMTLPWGNYQPLRIGYPAAGLLPALLFGFPAHLLGVPRLGLLVYLVALAVAVLAPAAWAARGSRGLERVVIFVALGVAAIPVWAVIDRGNTAGFVVPAALVFLIALRRQKWTLAAIMVVLAAIVKPWFFLLVVALFAARQWRAGGLAIVGAAVTNIGAYLLWPRDFPSTITQTVHNLSYIGNSFNDLVSLKNVSFGRAFVLLPDTFSFLQTGGKMPDGFLAGPRSLFGYLILIVVVVSLLVLSKRIPPVMAGIALLATATLFPPLAYYYYLVFALPIAALIVRDPEGAPGAGIFERLSSDVVPRRAVGFWVSLASALSIAQIVIPGLVVDAPVFGQFGARGVVDSTPVEFMTSLIFTPFLWLIACAAIIVSYARRPAQSGNTDVEPAQEEPADDAVGASMSRSESVSNAQPQEKA
jgi:hypothetical protein